MVLALPALADLRPLEGRCALGQAACFAETAKTTAKCRPILRRRATTERGETAADWRRCPVSGFRTVRDVDYVVVADPAGGVWAFTNFVDPTQAAVKDFRFLGKRLFLLQTSSTRDPVQRYCLLDLAAEVPACLEPPLAELEEETKKVLAEGESTAGGDFRIADASSKKISVSRPIFRQGKPAGSVNAILSVRDGGLTISRLSRGR